MIWISGVSFLWEAIDAGYRGHTSISTGNRELDGHSRFIIPRPSLRARKIPVRRCCHLASHPLYFQPRFPIDRLPVSFSLQPQEPLHKWPCPSFKITLETTDNDHQGRRRRASPPPLDSLPSQDSTSFSLSRLLSSPFLIERDTDILDPPTAILLEFLGRACKKAVPRASCDLEKEGGAWLERDERSGRSSLDLFFFFFKK